MDVGVLISLILGGASIFSSVCFGLIPNIRKSKLEQKDKKIQRVLLDIKLFYEIEEELLDQLEQKGFNKKSLKIQVRKKVSDKNGGISLSDYTKPSVVTKELQKC